MIEVQRKVGAAGTNENGGLINKADLEAIRTLWRVEEQDWSDSVTSIYRDVLSEHLEWIRYEIPLFSAEEQAVLSAICDKHGVSSEMMVKLVELERSMQGMSRRYSVQRKLTAVLEEDWRTVEEMSRPATEELVTCT